MDAQKRVCLLACLPVMELSPLLIEIFIDRHI